MTDHLSKSMIAHHEAQLKSTMGKFGFIRCKKITNTLQGSIWSALQSNTRRKVVVKVANTKLHDLSIIFVNDREYSSYENMVKENKILKYLSSDNNAPNSITQYIGFFKCNANYYFVMENGGQSLFEFVVKAHHFIEAGRIDICEWHKVVKIIWRQMVECIEYIHSKNVVHFDISLENFLINDVDINLTKDGQLLFCMDDIQIKICDFGLSEIFDKNSDFKSNKFCGKKNYKSMEINNKKTFNAKSNDIWCLGICLFMLLIGGSPWFTADTSDQRFVLFMKENGFKVVLSEWNKLHLVNDDLISLLESILQSENKRASIKDIKQSPFLQ